MYRKCAIALDVVPSERLGVLNLLPPLLSSCLGGDAERVRLTACASSERNAEGIHESIGEERPVSQIAAVLPAHLVDVVVPPFRDTVRRDKL